MRYHDIRPYSYNNVQIDSGHKYINASWIHIPKLRYFIATQGPIPNTIEDFWIMCNQYDVEKIIMLCELNENNMEKCAKYWDPKLMNNFEIKTIEESDVSKGIKSRVFKLFDKYKNNSKKIHQTQLYGWVDHSDLNIDNFDKIIKLINFINEKKTNKPVVVHCSAGVGRTGTFISLYNLFLEIMDQIRDNKKKTIEFSIFNLVRKIKELRMFMVENENQYILLYSFVNYILYNYNK